MDLDELILQLEEVTHELEAINSDDSFHVALEFGYQFLDELRSLNE